MFWLSFDHMGPFFQCTFIAGFWDNFRIPGFRNNFYRHSYQKAGTSSLKRVTERIFTISQKQAEILFWISFKKTTKNCVNHKRSFKKNCFDFYDLHKKYSSRATVHLSMQSLRVGIAALISYSLKSYILSCKNMFIEYRDIHTVQYIQTTFFISIFKAHSTI